MIATRLGRVIRQLEKAKRTWGMGDSFAMIDSAITELRELQDHCMRYRGNPPHPIRGYKTGDIISNEAHAILYRHAEDGKQYRHDFVNPTSLVALSRSGRHDVLITSPDGFPIWQEF